MFDVTKEEDEVLISLQQKDMKVHKPRGMGENLTIGFAVFKVYTRNVLYYMHDINIKHIFINQPSATSSLMKLIIFHHVFLLSKIK